MATDCFNTSGCHRRRISREKAMGSSNRRENRPLSRARWSSCTLFFLVSSGGGAVICITRPCAMCMGAPQVWSERTVVSGGLWGLSWSSATRKKGNKKPSSGALGIINSANIVSIVRSMGWSSCWWYARCKISRMVSTKRGGGGGGRWRLIDQVVSREDDKGQRENV